MIITIAGDLVPTESNLDLFNNGDVEKLLGKDLFHIWNNSDIRIFNLETPLADKKTPIRKIGPNLIAPTSTIKGIKNLKPTVVTLANNHIMDHGKEGLESTQKILELNNIPYTGVGKNINDAFKPYIIRKENYNIGIYACAEHEFSIAEENIPGANPFDPLESLDHISNLSKKCDYTVVLYHGGKEHYRYPSPYLQKICRKIIDKGANLVITQHSHCIGSYEIYNNSTIVYGQGNFIFDLYNDEYWNTGLFIKINLEQKNFIEFVPFMKNNNGVILPNESTVGIILNDFEERSKKIKEKNFIYSEYKKFSEVNLSKYLYTFGGFGKLKTKIDKYFLNNYLLKKSFNKDILLKIRNYLECEAHKELFLNGIKKEK